MPDSQKSPARPAAGSPNPPDGEEVSLLEDIGRLVDLSGPPRPRVTASLATADSMQSAVSSPGAAQHSADEDATEALFCDLALRTFSFQYRRVEPFRRLCESRGVAPPTDAATDHPAAVPRFDWRTIPAVPVEAWKSLKLSAAPPREIFRSSGTLGGSAKRSISYQAFPDLYRRVIDATFAQACFPSPIPESPQTPGAGSNEASHSTSARHRRPLLSLIPRRAQIPDSSLSFMVDHILERHGEDGSRIAFGREGVDSRLAAEWCETRQRTGQPGTVLATAFALVDWLDWLEDNGLSFRLPEGSTLFETGGFKGRAREVGRTELIGRAGAQLGLGSNQIVREYGMTELTGHLYTAALRGGDPDLFYPPPFLRVRLLDPDSLRECPPGSPGLIAFFDLANLGSVSSLLTQDMGLWDPFEQGLRLLGRARDAELRGCSLTVEELSRSRPTPML